MASEYVTTVSFNPNACWNSNWMLTKTEHTIWMYFGDPRVTNCGPKLNAVPTILTHWHNKQPDAVDVAKRRQQSPTDPGC